MDSLVRDELRSIVSPYLDLLVPFIGGSSTEKFQIAFISRYLKDETPRSDAVFQIFDRFFSDVDEAVEDPHLRAQVNGLDPDQLRGETRRLLDAAGLTDAVIK